MSTPNLIRYLSQWDLGSSKTPTDMLIKVFGNEVLTAYQDYLQFSGKVRSYTLATGNTMQFPAMWKIGSEYHEAGAQILGMDVETKEYTITLEDRPLITSAEFEYIDRMLAHFDIRSQVANEMARELARQVDKKIHILIAKAALEGVSESTATSFPNQIFSSGKIADAAFDDAESTYTAAAFNAVAVAITQALAQVSIVWNRNFIPRNGRHVAVTPAMFHALRLYGLPTFINATSGTINSNGVSPYPLMGSPQATFVNGPNTVAGDGPDIYLEYLGFKIFQSQNSPWLTALSSGPTKWQVSNHNTVCGLVWQEDAVGFIQKMGITTEQWYDPDTKTDKLSAMTYVGGGTLRPYCAVALTNA